jgi:hypothetical protein
MNHLLVIVSDRNGVPFGYKIVFNCLQVTLKIILSLPAIEGRTQLV